MLSSTQQEILLAILDRQSSNCLSKRIKPVDHLQIYRNNMLVALVRVLRSIYPIVERLVGSECFAGLAHQYIQQYPSTEPNLRAYGENMPSFLSNISGMSRTPYLPEVANLEWKIHELSFEIQDASRAIAKLLAIDPSDYSEITFKLQTNCRLLSYQYPIFDIWQLCHDQDLDIESMALTYCPVNLLLRGEKEQILLAPLTKAEFVMLTQISNKRSFREIVTECLAVDPEVDMELLLGKYLKNNCIVDCC